MVPNLASPFSPLSEVPVPQAQEEDLGSQESAPKRAPWFLVGMLLMGLYSYFPRLSTMSSLWTPLQAAIPVLHWMASWWILPPGWEPNLVSLAPLSHTNIFQALTGINLKYQKRYHFVLTPKYSKSTLIKKGEGEMVKNMFSSSKIGIKLATKYG
ncbi:hypothetical protein DSO57_1020084 [Entomophthora muscae]|uniref:Uncharacterized protein n=1 Tax=Entomophthora muscae TaxID=34485 RepID=A0ACC2T4P3_9FUNG|nr:hypothetical protein DSO57_1020084 [Entomophthora muscae]